MVDAYEHLLETLRAAIGVLELPPDAPLVRDGLAVCNPSSQAFRIVVFAPFNYGKSTLLNALLGERALPIDLIPTTGAAIVVKHGSVLATRIRFKDNTEINELGTGVLQRFAILDGDRRMRDDVTSVEVFCPHPFLQGVELVDLPGTDDREAQDALVKDQLLLADLVVQVLDGRKLMTLGEREHLRDWLLDRGIETVVFVVNFLNLLEPEEQKQVYNRLRFVAESFRAKLPPGVSNLYRVDALPALRARLKGDMPLAQASGLPIFESALQTIVQNQQAQSENRRSRLRAIARQVQPALQAKIDSVQASLNAVDSKQQQKTQIKQQAATLIRKGFTQSVMDFTNWLSLTNLLTQYQEVAAQALQQGQFRIWASGEFKRTAIDHQQAVAKWVQQACEFFERDRPNQLLVNFPPEPVLTIPPPPIPTQPSKKLGDKLGDLSPEALVGGALGWMVGGPVGAAIVGSASHLLNKTLDSQKSQPEPTSPPPPNYACLEAARDYLINFSSINLAALQRYQAIGDRLIHYQPTVEQIPSSTQRHQLQLLQTTLESLERAIEGVGIGD